MEKTYRYIEQVSAKLSEYSDFIRTPGLMDGKMGVAIFLYRCARLTGNREYDQCAERLLDDVLEELSIDGSLNFESGLCGIGYGVDYLIRNDYVAAESEDILEDIDALIISATKDDDVRITSLISAAQYWLQRKNEEQFSLVINKLTSYLIEQTENARGTFRYDHLTFFVFSSLVLFHLGSGIIPDQSLLDLYQSISQSDNGQFFRNRLDRNVYLIKEIDRLFYPETQGGNVPTSPDALIASDNITLTDLLHFRNNHMQYGIPYPEVARLKIRRILADEDLLEEWLDLAMPATMNINGYMTGFGWILLDLMQSESTDSHR